MPKKYKRYIKEICIHTNEASIQTKKTGVYAKETRSHVKRAVCMPKRPANMQKRLFKGTYDLAEVPGTAHVCECAQEDLQICKRDVY